MNDSGYFIQNLAVVTWLRSVIRIGIYALTNLDPNQSSTDRLIIPPKLIVIHETAERLGVYLSTKLLLPIHHKLVISLLILVDKTLTYAFGRYLQGCYLRLLARVQQIKQVRALTSHVPHPIPQYRYINLILPRKIQLILLLLRLLLLSWWRRCWIELSGLDILCNESFRVFRQFFALPLETSLLNSLLHLSQLSECLLARNLVIRQFRL